MKLDARCLLLLLCLAFFSRPVLSKPAGARGVKTNMVHQEADRLEYDDRRKIMHLSGHVKLWQGDTLLLCDHATYDLKTQEAEAEGNLKMSNPGGTVTGDKLQVYYKQKLAIVTGDVTLVYVPKKNPAQTVKKEKEKLVVNEPITMTSDELRYDWGNKTATAGGKVVLTQKGRKAYGDHAFFEEKPERLTMDGNVKLFRPPKDTLFCDHLVYELQTDHALAEGHVVGTFLVKGKK